jgi:hypothetical protein
MPRFPNIQTFCSASAIFLNQRHFIHHTTLPNWDRFMQTLFPFAQDASCFGEVNFPDSGNADMQSLLPFS